MVQLGANRYGKAEVRVVHVDRTAGPDGPDRVRDWNVSTSLAGDLASVHLSGDNAHALPTDTQKNTVYAMAKKLGGLEPEAFGLELAAHYTGSQEAISRARIAIEEYPWAPLGPGGHSFARSGQYTRTTTVIEDRELGRSVVSGVADLIVLNTTGSQFWGFPRDEYTTLADAYDRMLATTVSASWRFRTPDADWGTAFTAAFTALTARSPRPRATRCSRPCTGWAARCWPRCRSCAKCGSRCPTNTTSSSTWPRSGWPTRTRSTTRPTGRTDSSKGRCWLTTRRTQASPGPERIHHGRGEHMSEATVMTSAPREEPARHPVDQVPPPERLLILGLQHLFIMYAGAVAVPLIVGPARGPGQSDIAILVSADLLVSGIASIIQSVGISQGLRRPDAGGGRSDLHRAEPDDHHRQLVRRPKRPARGLRGAARAPGSSG